jgi:hypothetical protein
VVLIGPLFRQRTCGAFSSVPDRSSAGHAGLSQSLGANFDGHAKRKKEILYAAADAERISEYILTIE